MDQSQLNPTFADSRRHCTGDEWIAWSGTGCSCWKLSGKPHRFKSVSEGFCITITQPSPRVSLMLTLTWSRRKYFRLTVRNRWITVYSNNIYVGHGFILSSYQYRRLCARIWLVQCRRRSLKMSSIADSHWRSNLNELDAVMQGLGAFVYTHHRLALASTKLDSRASETKTDRLTWGFVSRGEHKRESIKTKTQYSLIWSII